MTKIVLPKVLQIFKVSPKCTCWPRELNQKGFSFLSHLWVFSALRHFFERKYPQRVPLGVLQQSGCWKIPKCPPSIFLAFWDFFSSKGHQFTNTLALWSPFAIFEPLIWRRLGPVPACYTMRKPFYIIFCLTINNFCETLIHLYFLLPMLSYLFRGNRYWQIKQAPQFAVYKTAFHNIVATSPLWIWAQTHLHAFCTHYPLLLCFILGLRPKTRLLANEAYVRFPNEKHFHGTWSKVSFSWCRVLVYRLLHWSQYNNLYVIFCGRCLRDFQTRKCQTIMEFGLLNFN